MRKNAKLESNAMPSMKYHTMIEGSISRLSFNLANGNRGKRAKVGIGPIKLLSYILVKRLIFTLALLSRL